MRGWSRANIKKMARKIKAASMFSLRCFPLRDITPKRIKGKKEAASQITLTQLNCAGRGEFNQMPCNMTISIDSCMLCIKLNTARGRSNRRSLSDDER